MSPDALKIRELFVAAVGKVQPEGWDAFLDEACGGRAELRHEVRELLQAHRDAGSFLGHPAAEVGATGAFTPAPGQLEALATLAMAEGPGTVIGPYKLLEQIGEGGMGLVFVAEQQRPVKRRVALKIIKPGMDSRQVIARFEAERQALAMMDHPNIAKVLDGGTIGAEPDASARVSSSLAHASGSAGRPYFVMELVKGTPITDYCDAHRLTTRDRLKLFIDVCHAVQHAHQKGIIHRDIKPSNVMVTVHDVTPVVKVIDFGIAKATGGQLTDKTVYTAFAQMVGTPLYMSPEQAGLSGLDVDTRSDVYSLGVLLYELLTGTTPFDSATLKKAGYDEMRRIIREDEPPRPSARLSTMQQAALSTIAEQRGLEPRRLSRQVRGELDWIVMRALEKDRNRRYESANGFAQDVQRYLADEPVQACPPSAAYRLRKFARRNRARLAVAAVLGLALLGMAGSFGWSISDRASRQAVVSVRVNDALDESERLYRAGKVSEALTAAKRGESVLATGPADDQLTVRVHDRIQALETVLEFDKVLFDINGNADWPARQAESERLFRVYGIDLSAQPAEEAGALIRDRFIAIDLAAALDLWVHVRSFEAKIGDDAFGRKLIAVARQADPDPWRDRARQALDRDDTAALEKLARTAPLDELPPATLRTIGLALLARYQQGSPAQPARDFLRRAQRRHSGDLWLNHLLADSLTWHTPHAYDEGVGFWRVLLALRPNSPGIYNKLGWSMTLNGKPDEAICYYRMLLEFNPNDVGSLSSLAGALQRAGLLHEATACYREAIKLDPDAVLALNNLAWMLATCADVKLRDPDQASQFADKAVQLAPKSWSFRNTLGVAQYRQGDWKGSITTLGKSMQLGKGGNSADFFFLAMAHWRLGEKDKARSWYDKAVLWMDKRAPQDEQMKRFRAEAAELLEITAAEPELVPLPKPSDE